eukprot:scaffold26899_cov34-Phaeocystis_antarctica.AAC.1
MQSRQLHSKHGKLHPNGVFPAESPLRYLPKLDSALQNHGLDHSPQRWAFARRPGLPLTHSLAHRRAAISWITLAEGSARGA